MRSTGGVPGRVDGTEPPTIGRRRALAAAAAAVSLAVSGCAASTPDTRTGAAATGTDTPDAGASATTTETDAPETATGRTETTVVTTVSADSRQEVTYAEIAVSHPAAAEVGQPVTLAFRLTARRALSAYRVELRPPAAFEEPTESLVWEFTDLEPEEQAEWTVTLRAAGPTNDLLLVESTGRPAGEEYDFERRMAVRIPIGDVGDGDGTGPGGGVEPVTSEDGQS